MLSEMTTEQFDEWAAYYAIEPWDFRSLVSIICKQMSDCTMWMITTIAKVDWRDNYSIPLKSFFIGWRPKQKRKRILPFWRPGKG